MSKQVLVVTGVEDVLGEDGKVRKLRVHAHALEACGNGNRVVVITPPMTTKSVIDVPLGERFIVWEENTFKDDKGTQRKFNTLISVDDPKEISAQLSMLSKFRPVPKT